MQSLGKEAEGMQAQSCWAAWLPKGRKLLEIGPSERYQAEKELEIVLNGITELPNLAIPKTLGLLVAQSIHFFWLLWVLSLVF